MDLFEIKHEFECDSGLQCRTCLSVGRKLVPLGDLANIYMKITADFQCNNPDYSCLIEICWECESLLKKISFFRNRVKKANDLLLTGQSLIYGTLSSLTSVTLNDTHHKIYLNDINTFTHKKSNSLTNDLALRNNIIHDNSDIVLNKTENEKANGHDMNRVDNVTSHDNNNVTIFYGNNQNSAKLNNNFVGMKVSESEKVNSCRYLTNNDVSNNSKGVKDKAETIRNTFFNSSEEEDNLEDFRIKNNNVSVTKEDINKKKKIIKKNLNSEKKRSLWALKKARQNKKPKYKIVSTNFEESFIKVQISPEELAQCIQRERDSEYYNSKKFVCEICSLGFVNEIEWQKHQIGHRKISGLYTCDICKIKIDNKRHLSVHIAQHYCVYQCTICHFVCRSQEQSFWHFQMEHKNLLQCLKCDLKFGNRNDFLNHFKEWHEKFVCDYCGISFKMRYCIKNHIRKQHSPFTCRPCNKTFARYNGLWLHNKLVHTPVASPAYCVECDRNYKDIYRYKWHLCNSARHTPKKKVRIPCTECEKTFTKKIYMKDHYNLVHLKLFKHRCEQCDKNFIRNADLMKHRRRVHEGILPPKDKICCMCGRGFTTNKILLNHVRTHTGERPHACGACPARFTQRHALRTHMRDAHKDLQKMIDQ